MAGDAQARDSAWRIVRARSSSRRLTSGEEAALHRLEVALRDVAIVVVAHRRDLDDHEERLGALEGRGA